MTIQFTFEQIVQAAKKDTGAEPLYTQAMWRSMCLTLLDRLDGDEPAMYARDLDGTGSLHPCAQGDDGAIALYTRDQK